jgi:hypothetical protein
MYQFEIKEATEKEKARNHAMLIHEKDVLDLKDRSSFSMAGKRARKESPSAPILSV